MKSERAAFAMQKNRFYRAKAALLDCKNGTFAERKDNDKAQNIAYMRIKVFVLRRKRYGLRQFGISLLYK